MKQIKQQYRCLTGAIVTLSGVFNITSDNYTVGQVGDMVKAEVERLTGHNIQIRLDHIEDFRNYKVTAQKAKTYLGFQPSHTVEGQQAEKWALERYYRQGT